MFYTLAQVDLYVFVWIQILFTACLDLVPVDELSGCSRRTCVIEPLWYYIIPYLTWFCLSRSRLHCLQDRVNEVYCNTVRILIISLFFNVFAYFWTLVSLCISQCFSNSVLDDDFASSECFCIIWWFKPLIALWLFIVLMCSYSRLFFFVFNVKLFGGIHHHIVFCFLLLSYSYLFNLMLCFLLSSVYLIIFLQLEKFLQ